MKLYQTILILLITLSLSAQVTVEPSTIEFKIPAASETYSYKFDITNTETKSVELYWMLELGEGWKDEWSLMFCDKNLCYGDGTLKCPDNKPSILMAGESTIFKFDFNNKGVKGISSLTLKLFTLPGCENEIFSSGGQTEIQVGGTSNVYDINVKPIAYSYPNPTQEHLEIRNDEDIAAIKLLDYSGKMFYKSTHVEGQIHDLQHISGGIYILKMIKEDGDELSDQVVKVD